MTARDPNEVSPTFCVLPFIHIATNTAGAASICCLSRHTVKQPGKQRDLHLGYDSYEVVWNSEHFRQVRLSMLRGEKVEACRQCYVEEALGGHSMRLGMTHAWLKDQEREVLERVDKARESGRVEAPPLYLDLRQGNLCNLRCRSCSPENSVMIERDYKEIAGGDQWFRENIGEGRLPPSVADWYQQPLFLAELRTLLPSLRKLYFTGGEPTLIESNYALLDECVERGLAANIELMFNTNLVLLPDEFLKVLPRFHHTVLNLSIEGFGRVQEYLRFPSKWAIIEKNLRKLLDARIENVYIFVNPVVQLANVLEITDLFRFLGELNLAYDKRIHLLPIILHEPRYLDMVLLANDDRRLAIERLGHYRDEARAAGYLDELFESRILQIINRLGEPPPGDAEDLRGRFRQFTAALDRQRGQSFAHTFPELAHLMVA
jgi:MoaA/NifB/PqqE/SkfB family radical SAM enzyme